MSFNYSTSWSYFPIVGSISTGVTTATGHANAISDKVIVKLYPFWYKQVNLEWSMPANWGNCFFNIYRCESQDGDFILLNTSPLSGNTFTDTSTMAFSKFNKDYYIVEVILSTGQVIRSTPTSWQNTRTKLVDLKALDIQRREWLLLTKFTGIESYVFRRRTYGERCPNCWNPDTEMVTKDDCQVCFGTSFKGGYFPATKTYIQYDPTPNSLALDYFGKFESNQIPAWTISYPEMNSFDLVLRKPDWKMYRINNIGTTELQAVQVRQLLQLIELDKESVEYKLILTDDSIFPAEYR